MTFTEYCSSLNGKSVAVLGIGVSNRPLLTLLAGCGAKVTACDKKTREQLGDICGELEKLGVSLHLGESYLDGLDQDIIFRSPGIRYDRPEIAAAVEKGSMLTSEMEAFFDVCPCPIVAVTGSDGKTTTTTLVHELLKAAGYTCHLGGNIGHPLLCDTPEMTENDRVVVELSSFQLMTMKKCAGTAIVTNVAPNHLDVHKDMQEYIDCKANVYRTQKGGDLLVVNDDNDITREFAASAAGKVRRFSRMHPVENGCYLKDDVIYWAENGNAVPLLNRSEIRLRGIHNVENLMAAICAVYSAVSVDVILKVAHEFGGVEHRIEFVRTLDGVDYYNDSIASSPTRMMAALHSFDRRLIVIAGGYDKKIPFDALGPEMADHVKALVLCGQTAPKIRASLLAAPNYDPEKTRILECTELSKAVELARSSARPGDIVILSPACAAFDQFANFAVRGAAFKKIVNSLK